MASTLVVNTVTILSRPLSALNLRTGLHLRGLSRRKLVRLALPGTLLMAACEPAPEAYVPEAPEAYLFKKYINGTGVDGYIGDEDFNDATAYYARAAADLSGIPGEKGAGIAPPTLDDFKIQFNIPTQEEGESVEEYRDRVGASVYFNSNELGLGRELVCSAASPETNNQPGFVDSDGVSIGVGCYVTNYAGAGDFYDLDGAMDNATSEAPSPKNTVAITYRPTRPEGERVQFWVYGTTGLLQNWAQLDHHEGLEPEDEMRPVPSVCTECHGGTYKQGEGVAKNARFLPVNPAAVNLGYSTEDIKERMRAANCVAWNSTSMSPMQLAWLKSLYGEEGPCGTAAEQDSVPPGWESDKALWHKAVLPYCGTCHLAMPEMKLLESAEVFKSIPLATDVCGSDTRRPVMPHALPTFREMWAGNPSPGSLLVEALPDLQSCN